jgi:hypothetical protein
VYNTIPLTRTSASTKGARIRPPDPVAKEDRGTLPPVRSISVQYTSAFSAFQLVYFYSESYPWQRRRRRRRTPSTPHVIALPATTPLSDDPSKTSLSVPPNTQTQQSRSTVPAPPQDNTKPTKQFFTPIPISKHPKNQTKKKKTVATEQERASHRRIDRSVGISSANKRRSNLGGRKHLASQSI